MKVRNKMLDYFLSCEHQIDNLHEAIPWNKRQPNFMKSDSTTKLRSNTPMASKIPRWNNLHFQRNISKKQDGMKGENY